MGDRVYALGFLNPKGGLYAAYAVVPEDLVAPIPAALTVEQAAGVSRYPVEDRGEWKRPGEEPGLSS